MQLERAVQVLMLQRRIKRIFAKIAQCGGVPINRIGVFPTPGARKSGNRANGLKLNEKFARC